MFARLLHTWRRQILDFRQRCPDRRQAGTTKLHTSALGGRVCRIGVVPCNAIKTPHRLIKPRENPVHVGGCLLCCVLLCHGRYSVLLVPAPTVGACNTGYCTRYATRVNPPRSSPVVPVQRGLCSATRGGCVVYGTHGQPVPVCARVCPCVPVGAQRGLCSATRGGCTRRAGVLKVQNTTPGRVPGRDCSKILGNKKPPTANPWGVRSAPVVCVFTTHNLPCMGAS